MFPWRPRHPLNYRRYPLNRCRQDSRAKVKKSQSAAAAAPVVAPAAAEPRLPQQQGKVERARATRALHIYREEIIKRDRALQKKFNPASSQYWNEVKEGFANLAPEQRSGYETRAAHTVGESLLGRSTKCARGEGKAAAIRIYSNNNT